MQAVAIDNRDDFISASSQSEQKGDSDTCPGSQQNRGSSGADPQQNPQNSQQTGKLNQ